MWRRHSYYRFVERYRRDDERFLACANGGKRENTGTRKRLWLWSTLSSPEARRADRVRDL